MRAFSFVALLAAALPKVVGGTPVPPGGHPEALALAAPDAAGAARVTCSMALVAPRIALTAAHCVADLADGARRSLRAYAGEGSEGGVFSFFGPFTRVTAVAVHPLFREHPLGQADLALLFLEDTPQDARPAPFAQSLAAFRALIGIGKPLTLVGYGRREEEGLGRKYEATTTVAAFSSQELLTEGDGRDGCAGDSGGPALADGTVVGVIARGRTFTCGRGGYVSLTTAAACWIAATAGLTPDASCLGAPPHYSLKALAGISPEALCTGPGANPTQRETLAALALALGTPDCAALGAALRAARSLDLDDLMLRDLSPLANLPALEGLSLAGNRLTDVTALATLPRLARVALDGNDVTAFPPLPGVTVHGRHRQLHNFAATAFLAACGDAALPAAARLTVQAVKWATETDDCRQANQRLLALGALSLAAQGLTDLAPLADLPTVRRLSLADNPALTDVGPLAGLEDLRALDLAGTAVTDVSPLAALIAQGLVITP